MRLGELKRLARPNKKILWTYNPVRDALGDIYNWEIGFFSKPADTSLEQIEKSVRDRCKSPEAAKNNLQAARALYSFRLDGDVTARGEQFGGFAVGVAHSVKFWTPCVYLVEGRPVIAFHDFRRQHNLTAAARRLVASVQNEHIRQQYPDLADARLAVFALADVSKTERRVLPYFLEADGLYSGEEVARLFAETLAEWVRVNEEQVQETRRTAASGDLFKKAG